MLYQRRTFTCPASTGASQKTWDRAFLGETEFIAKYPEETGCTKLSTGSTSAATATTSA